MNIAQHNFDPNRLDGLMMELGQGPEFLLHRDVFRDPEIFELEMKYIFERNWVYLAHESQLPNPNDFYSTWIGRTPVIVWRDGAGKVGAFVNSCAHKGARVCHRQAGNAKQFVCGYHGWVYGSNGANVLVKDQDVGAYAPTFDDFNHDLSRIKTEVYNGLIFGSLTDDVPTLDDHLAPIKPLINLVTEQGPDGVEMIPGVSTYTYRGNWKWQIENCVDAYHLSSAHPSFMNVVKRRQQGESRNKQVKSIDFTALLEAVGGSYTFPRGHALVWGQNPQKEERPLWHAHDEIRARCGELRANWMLYTRNLTIYPNVQFAENASLQCRIIRPLAVDLTEMTIFCVGPKNEASEARQIRLRQYEDFFNTSGMATPDDTIAYEDCQAGVSSPAITWQQGYARGARAAIKGPDDYARELGIEPDTSCVGTFNLQDEMVFRSGYRAWLDFLKHGLRQDGATG